MLYFIPIANLGAGIWDSSSHEGDLWISWSSISFAHEASQTARPPAAGDRYSRILEIAYRIPIGILGGISGFFVSRRGSLDILIKHFLCTRGVQTAHGGGGPIGVSGYKFSVGIL